MPNTTETINEIKKLDTIINTSPGIVKDEWIRVELCIKVNRDWMVEYLEGEYDFKGREQDLKSLINKLERDLEGIKNTSYRHPLPDWVETIECAEISEVK
jgi:hypothetical protein